jgi:ketosteroid isomerase-like protein
MAEEFSVDQFFESVNRRDLNMLEKLMSEDAEFCFPKTQPLVGRKQIIRFFKILFRQYPELVFEVQRKIVQRGSAAVHWVNRGVNKEGEPYNNEGVTLLEMETDRVTFISDFFKDTGKF